MRCCATHGSRGIISQMSDDDRATSRATYAGAAFDTATHQQLRVAAAERRITIADALREAVNLWLARESADER